MNDISSGIKNLIEKLDTTGEMSLEEIRDAFYKVNPEFKEDEVFNDLFPIIFKVYRLKREIKKKKN